MTDEEKIDAFADAMKKHWFSTPKGARLEIKKIASDQRIGALGREGLLQAAIYTVCAYYNIIEPPSTDKPEHPQERDAGL